MIRVHKVFISYHHENDEYYRDALEEILWENGVIVSKSVQFGDIDPHLQTDTIRRKIRDEYIRDSTVSIVLVGTDTWRRKHVDWEIAASIVDGKVNKRSGLFGLFLPSHPDFDRREYSPWLIPARLHYNRETGYAELYDWRTDIDLLGKWIHQAFLRRKTHRIDQSYPLYQINKRGSGWT